MNVHTVEIAQHLGPGMMKELCRKQQWFEFGTSSRNKAWNSMKDFLIDIDEPSANILESEMYPAIGIQKVTLIRNPSRQGYFYFVAVVNMESLYRRDVTVESFDLTDATALQQCEEEFAQIMEMRSNVRFRSLLDWSTRRIDYAVDVRVPGCAEAYIELFKKGRIPRGMLMRQQYDGSYYLETDSDDVTINFYSKQDQLRKDRYLSNDDRLLREAENLLRLEVQCQGQKLDHLRNVIRRRGLLHDGMKLRTFLNAEIANIVVQDYFRRSIGYLDYHSLDSARDYIATQPGRSDIKERVISFLQQVDEAGSVEAAIWAFRSGTMPNGSQAIISGPESSLQNMLNRYLPRFGLNPVLIPSQLQRTRLVNPMPLNLRSE